MLSWLKDNPLISFRVIQIRRKFKIVPLRVKKKYDCITGICQRNCFKQLIIDFLFQSYEPIKNYCVCQPVKLYATKFYLNAVNARFSNLAKSPLTWWFLIGSQCDFVYTTFRIKRKKTGGIICIFRSLGTLRDSRIRPHRRDRKLGRRSAAVILSGTQRFLSLLGEISREACSRERSVNQFSRQWPWQKGRWIHFCRIQEEFLCGTRVCRMHANRECIAEAPSIFALCGRRDLRWNHDRLRRRLQIHLRLPCRWKLYHSRRSEIDLVDASMQLATLLHPVCGMVRLIID